MMLSANGTLLFRGSLMMGFLPLELRLLLKSPFSSRSVGTVRLRIGWGLRSWINSSDVKKNSLLFSGWNNLGMYTGPPMLKPGDSTRRGDFGRICRLLKNSLAFIHSWR